MTLLETHITTCAAVSWMWLFPVQLFTLKCGNTNKQLTTSSSYWNAVNPENKQLLPVRIFLCLLPSQVCQCKDQWTTSCELWEMSHCREWTRGGGAEIWFCPEEVNLFYSLWQQLKWRSKKINWTEKDSAVRSVWIYWRIRWLLAVDTATVWAVLTPTGTKGRREEATAALSVDRPSHRGLSWWKAPC